MNEQQNKKTGKPITMAEFENEQKDMIASMDRARDDDGFFMIKSINGWLEVAKHTAAPRQLFRELWHEGEVCILFADTNTGKSILAVQIGEQISAEHLVLYFDFELSVKQFETRYANNYNNHYRFSENIKRIVISPDAEIPEGWLFEEYLNDRMERAIIKTGAKILIIDNLTYLRQETEQAKDALPLMKQLKMLKNKHNLSILCLAHTPKRDMSKPITRNDLQGSKMLMNFCDSAFSIGESASDNTMRYIKQIKARNTEVIYDSNNVIVARIVKPDNFLCFEFMGYGKERDYLKQNVNEEKEELKKNVLELHQRGKSLREIAEELGIHFTTVGKILRKR